MTIDTTNTQTVTAPARPALRVALAILISMCAIYFFSFFQRVAVPGTIFDQLQSDFQISAGLVAGLSSLYLYIYGGMQFISGVLNDRFGAARIMLACGVLLTVGSILFPLSRSVTTLYAARTLVGLGASLAYVSLIKQLDDLFTPRQFPVYLGIALVLGYAGGLVATSPFSYTVAHCGGWRGPLFAVGVLSGVALLAAVVLFKRTGLLAPRPRTRAPLAFGIILRNRATLPLLIAVPINFAVYFLLQSTLGMKFLVDYCGVSTQAASTCTFAMMLSMMSVALASGFLTRAIGNRRKPLIVVAILCALGGYLCLLWGLQRGYGGSWFLFSYVLLASSNLASPIANVLMIELSPPEAVGTAIGLLNGFFYVFVAVLTSLAGMVMNHYQSTARVTAHAVIYPKEAYLMILLICAALSLASLIIAAFLREPRQNISHAA